MSEKSKLDFLAAHHDLRYQVESHGGEGSHHVAVRSVRLLRHRRPVQVCLQQSPPQLSVGPRTSPDESGGSDLLYMPPAGLANLCQALWVCLRCLRVCFHRAAPNCPMLLLFNCGTFVPTSPDGHTKLAYRIVY